MLSNGSRGTLMSYTDHSVQRRLKSNVPIGMIESERERSRACGQVKNFKSPKQNHYFYLNIAKIAPCRKKINKSRSNNEKVAKFGDKIPKLATLVTSIAQYSCTTAQ